MYIIHYIIYIFGERFAPNGEGVFRLPVFPDSNPRSWGVGHKIRDVSSYSLGQTVVRSILLLTSGTCHLWTFGVWNLMYDFSPFRKPGVGKRG